jgi:hypothetical protein
MSLKHGQYICDFVSLQQNFLQWALIFFHFNGFKKKCYCYQYHGKNASLTNYNCNGMLSEIYFEFLNNLRQNKLGPKVKAMQKK